MTRPAADHRYRAFGLNLRSCLELPGLTPAVSPGDDVEVRYGEVPAEIAGAVDRGVRYQSAPGTLRLQVDGVVDYLVQDGRTITIARDPAADEADVRALLLGPVLGALLHQRGEVVLRASAIAWEGRAVIFLGRPGAGKSTLAAAFRRRGYATLADDLCVVRTDDRGRMVAWPAFPQARLWGDSLHQLGLRAEELARVRPALEKRAVPLSGAAFAVEALPVRKLYVLRPCNREVSGLESIAGPAKLVALQNHQAGGGARANEAGDARRLAGVLRLAQQAALSVVHRGGELARLDGLVETIAEDLRA